MQDKNLHTYIKNVVENMPADWLNLTTHRLDIYVEKLAKTQFLEQFENLYNNNNATASSLSELPTAYDYIRLGHPLSSVLEWTIAKLYNTKAANVISFSSQTVPVLAVLRANLFANKNTQIVYTNEIPSFFDTEVIKNVYGYQFELKKVDSVEAIPKFDGSTVLIVEQEAICNFTIVPNVDFYINTHPELGSFLLVNGEQNDSYISDIQHVRRRETIAMTPTNSLKALKSLIDEPYDTTVTDVAQNKGKVEKLINEITNTSTKALVASSGLSIQYAILMGLIDDALENHKGKRLKL